MKKNWFFLIVSFLFMGMMHAQENYFTPDGATGSAIATFWCEVRIDGVAQTSGDIEVAEFVDGSCRQTTRLRGYYNNTFYCVLLDGQYEGGGKIVTFKCYDHSTGIEYAECPYTYTTTGSTEQVSNAANPVVLEFTTPSFDKLIVGYRDNPNGYYLIASPLANDVDPITIDGMILTGDDAVNYDLFAFGQGSVLEWLNYKQNNFNLVNGKGYLYAQKDTVILTFKGRPYSGNGEVTLTKADEGEGLEFPDWNLVGNPFPDPAYIAKPYYYMNELTSEIIIVESPSSRAVDAMEGIFVVAETNPETLVFSTEEPSRNPAALVMELTSNRSNGVVDRAVVDFNQGYQLEKFMLNEENTNISFAQGDEAFAMIHSNGQGEMQVNFKARTDGSYTLSVNPKNIEMGYLHLVDNLTGDDTDLLQTPSYTFDASVGDADSRFMLKFATRNHWIPDDHATQDNATLFAVVQINGVNIEDGTNWEVGAFNQYGVCRGVCNIENGWVPENDPSMPYSYYMFLVIHGLPTEEISFKLYDRANDEENDMCDVVLTWYSNEIWGNLWNPFILNFMMPQSYTKEIEGYGENTGGYYLIASPLSDAVTPTIENGFLVNDYDLYRFNQAASLEWENWENTESDHYQFELVSGTGYLYANSVGTTLTFTGYPYSGNGEVTLTKANEADGLDFPDWNLVGNPFTVSAYLPTGRSFYSMQNAEDFTPETGGNTAIEAMNGVFVIANEDGEVLTFSTTAPGKASKLVMDLSNNRGSFLDRAIVRFDEGDQLPKLQLRSGSTKVYIPQDNVDYAVANSEEMGTIPVNFKAESNGTYTLSFTNEEVSFAYLHLIDNMTGIETDLLANPSYSFVAKTTDYESRFKLVFATGNNSNEDNFAFFSNGSLVINNEGEATLQVIDNNGRIVKSESINGCTNVDVNAASGIYMLRLVNGENVKVQKVVVK